MIDFSHLTPRLDNFELLIDVYVGYLRREIEAEGETPLIHTIRGVGYRISEDAGDEEA